MPPDLRRAQILELVRRRGGASIQNLAASCNVAPITIHRDLERLAEEGLIRRVRGGARAIDGESQRARTDWHRRLGQAPEAKQAIAAAARKLVVDGSTVFLDASTSVLALARELARHPPAQLTLVTNSPAIAYELIAGSIHVVVTPGEIDQNLRLIAGPWTDAFLGQLNFETSFISGVGLTVEQGLLTGQRSIADTLRAATAVSGQTIALVDSSKLGRSSLLPIAAISDLDAVVVDREISPETVAAFEGAGLRLIIAQ